MTETTTPTTTPTTPFYRAPSPLTLTPEDCAAMKAATSYVVRLDGHTASLELTRKTDARVAGFGRTNVELTRTIGGDAGSRVRATFVQLYATGSWQALARIVRPGDVLRFWAYDDNGNGYTRAAEIVAGKWVDGHERFTAGYPRLYADELRVSVDRKGHQLIDGMLLTYSICPDNSARAVRPSPRPELAATS